MKSFIKTKRIPLFSLIVLLFVVETVQAQIETTSFNQSEFSKDESVYFFTNRPIVVKKDNSFTFKNSSTKQTNTLYFCTYNFKTDSIELNFRAINFSDKYPTGKVKNNFLYDMYKRRRIDQGIKNFYFVVGGYGKTFDKQVHSYMQRLKGRYGKSLFGKVAIVTFAWGTEEDVYQYYNAVRKSKNGAADFAIFEHMLEEFVSDTTFFKTHPNDLTIDILFSSMGNNLFKEYMERRKAQNIPLKKVYNRILFFGSVAPRNSFEKGKAFYDLNQMTDTVDVYVNSKDILLKMSSLAHLKSRMGNKGPKNPEKLPGYINIIDVTNLITKEDMAKMGHDYLLTNPVLQDQILTNIEANVESKKKKK